MNKIKVFSILIFASILFCGCVRSDYGVSIAAQIVNNSHESVTVVYLQKVAQTEKEAVLMPGDKFIISQVDFWSTKDVDFRDNPDSFAYWSGKLAYEMPSFVKFIFEDGRVYEYFSYSQAESNPTRLSSYTFSEDLRNCYYNIVDTQ